MTLLFSIMTLLLVLYHLHFLQMSRLLFFIVSYLQKDSDVTIISLMTLLLFHLVISKPSYYYDTMIRYYFSVIMCHNVL